MRNPKWIALLLAPLCGCFAQLDSSDVQMTHMLCSPSTTNCIPGGGAPLAIIQVSGSNTFVVDFGDQPLLKPSNDLGPTTLKTKLLLSGGAFDMITSGADFSGVQTVTLLAVIPPNPGGTDPCATPSNCTTVATYDRTTDGAATTHLPLKGNGSDLVTLIDQSTHQLTLEIRATGTAPSPALWNANASMDMSLNSKADFP
jgi:hypothetical protein